MKVAFSHDWLSALFSSNAQLQLVVGAHWQAVASLVVLIGSVSQLGLLERLPAVEVLAGALAGSTGYVIIRMGEVELHAQAVDDRGRILAVTEGEKLNNCERLLMQPVVIAGVAVDRPRTA